jgi:trans-aconitate methyltransferase
MMNIHDHRSYKGPRPDLTNQLVNPTNVLDVGCNNGAVARALKQSYPDIRIWGIDINTQALNEARPVLEKGWALDLDNTDLRETLQGLSFDHIIAGDVLEHTIEYKRITGHLYNHLKPGGKLIISVPNYGHWHTLYVFFTRKWQRNERGIFDKTHRTIIMKGNIPEFIDECKGAKIHLSKRNYRLFETNRYWKVNMILTYLIFPLMFIPYINDFITMSYVICITKPE